MTITAGRTTTSGTVLGEATVAGSASGAAAVSMGPGTAPAPGTQMRTKVTHSGGGPQPAVTRLVQEYAIPHGQAVKTTQIINGKGISGVTETMKITQTKARQFSSKKTTQIGKAPPVTTVTSSTPKGTEVKLTLGAGKRKLEMNALPPLDFDIKSLTTEFFSNEKIPEGGKFDELLDINAKIDEVKKKVDSVFKTGFFAAEDEYWDKIGGISQRFEDTSKKFKELGLKYPELKLEF
ncbi:uncharacterized protein LOC119089310 [Pollicipes pollicipes]|uniref:uncharacterized protein LOC119089310 n=1 Tax=Pollicipes pollicipes TaxID=41117 RepID=UPI0018858BCE|nr:uncharacterized protein LOC119089310 [Pollicipes pollicipes]